MTDLICIGAIVGAFGVKGDVRVKSFCAYPAALDQYGILTSEDGQTQFDLKLIKPVKGGYAARIKGVHHKGGADALKGTGLYVARQVLPLLPDDEFYHSDLIGLDVVDTGGKPLGQITAIHDHGAGDVLEIKCDRSKTSVLLPFTRTAVPTVDLSARRIIVDPPDGVFLEYKNDSL